MPRRTLSLKREVLAELTAPDLAIVNGAAPPKTTTATEVTGVANTAYSCWAYISCNALACVVRDATDIVVTVVKPTVAC